MIDSSLDRIIDSMIKQRDLDPQEIQSKIDENIYFRYNSVNLVIGKRGSGKTYTTLREILKLALTGHKEYTQIHYITDKARDDTVDKFKHHIGIEHLVGGTARFTRCFTHQDALFLSPPYITLTLTKALPQVPNRIR